MSESIKKYWEVEIKIISRNFLETYLKNTTASVLDFTSAHMIINLEQSHHLLFIFGSFVYEHQGNKNKSYFNLVLLVHNSEERMNYLNYAFSEKGTAGYSAIESLATNNGIHLDYNLTYSYIDEDIFEAPKVMDEFFELIGTDNGIQLYK